ncbi:MAG: hypothetical protein ACREE7_19190, partial [Dongiaceae bacterium]
MPDLIQRIQQAYWHVPGSVTAGLRAAIEAGNTWLVDHNQSAMAPTRAGVTCVVLRGPEIFIAQAGPSCAYVAHQGRIERFPRGDSGGNLPQLGVARAVEVRFSRADLQPGDALLLTDASFPARIPEQAVASSIVYAGVEAALNNLGHLIGGESLTAMVIEVAAAAPAATAQAESIQPAPAPRDRSRAQSTAAAAPRPAPKIGGGEKTAYVWASAIGKGVSRSAGSLGTAARMWFQRTLPDRPRQARRRAPR